MFAKATAPFARYKCMLRGNAPQCSRYTLSHAVHVLLFCKTVEWQVKPSGHGDTEVNWCKRSPCQHHQNQSILQVSEKRFNARIAERALLRSSKEQLCGVAALWSSIVSSAANAIIVPLHTTQCTPVDFLLPAHMCEVVAA